MDFGEIVSSQGQLPASTAASSTATSGQPVPLNQTVPHSRVRAVTTGPVVSLPGGSNGTNLFGTAGPDLAFLDSYEDFKTSPSVMERNTDRNFFDNESVCLEELADLLDEKAIAIEPHNKAPPGMVFGSRLISLHPLQPAATSTVSPPKPGNRNPLVVTQISTSVSTSTSTGTNNSSSTINYPKVTATVAKPIRNQKQRRSPGACPEVGGGEVKTVRLSPPLSRPSPAPGATLAAMSALLKSWNVPKECLGSLAAESCHGFIFVVEPGKGRMEYVSENVISILGSTSQDLQGQAVFNFLHPGDHLRLQGLFSNQNPEPGPRDAKLSFSARFVTSRRTYEEVAVNYVIVQKSEGRLNPPFKNTVRLICVARRSSDVLNVNNNNVVSGDDKNVNTENGGKGLFSTKVDPTSFKVLVSEILPYDGPKNTPSLLHASVAARTGTMVGKCLLDFCHPDDKDILRNHFVETLRDKTSTSRKYRLCGLISGGQKVLHVQTFSRYEKGGGGIINGNGSHHPNHAINKDKGYVVSKHSVIASPLIDPIKAAGSADAAASLLVSTANSKPSGIQAKNPTLSSMLSPSAPSSKPNLDLPKASSPNEAKHLLLKQLLNTNYKRNDGADHKQVQNTRIIQLLNDSSSVSVTKNEQSQDGRTPLKRAYSSPTSTSAEYNPTSAKKAVGSICSENPSLASLLSKPTVPSITVPPPVPTIWHQEPKERLPKDVMRKFLTPHPADRAKSNNVEKPPTPGPIASTSRLLLQPVTTASIPSPAPVQHQSPTNMQLADLDLETDPLLSSILDDVIDFQEKSPPLINEGSSRMKHPSGSHADAAGAGPAIGVCDSSNPSSLAEHSQIRDIEKFLTSSTESIPGLGSSSSSSNPAMVERRPPSIASAIISLNNPVSTSSSPSSVISSNPSLTSILSAPPITARPPPPGAQPVNPIQVPKNPASMVPRMNELLQVVPPNVSIPDYPDLVSLIHIQQNENDRRRRMSSGSSTAPSPSTSGIPSTTSWPSSQVLSVSPQNPNLNMNHQVQLQQRRASYSGAPQGGAMLAPQGLQLQQMTQTNNPQHVQQPPPPPSQLQGLLMQQSTSSLNRRRSSGGYGKVTTTQGVIETPTARRRQLSGAPGLSIMNESGSVIGGAIQHVSGPEPNQGGQGPGGQSLLQKLLSEK